eukprot:Blabericola_migrator_1__4063@NODE_2239_length_3070_cov_133_593407_g464_i1_p4_GENE_NODE_2239_length_3070_cov_133_593407_g464_i1NODE_2239_length_3070_cov_133_593407_g464_i1_p4_ORF_typecomplete_len167_score18_68_NODE_2239_length_3070_cov_133_593407_g464_i113021802
MGVLFFLCTCTMSQKSYTNVVNPVLFARDSTEAELLQKHQDDGIDDVTTRKILTIQDPVTGALTHGFILAVYTPISHTSISDGRLKKELGDSWNRVEGSKRRRHSSPHQPSDTPQHDAADFDTSNITRLQALRTAMQQELQSRLKPHTENVGKERHRRSGNNQDIA